jgi:hypothetical protein
VSSNRVRSAGQRMNCDEVRRTLDTYLDGELDESASGGVETHLSDCTPENLRLKAYTVAAGKSKPLLEQIKAQFRRHARAHCQKAFWLRHATIP